MSWRHSPTYTVGSKKVLVQCVCGKQAKCADRAQAEAWYREHTGIKEVKSIAG